MAGTLSKRIAFAIPAIIVTAGLLWFGGWPLTVAIAALGVLGAREVYDLARRHAIEQRLRPFADAADGLLIQEVEARALLLNTSLRWFRKRRPVAAEADAAPIALAA